MIASGGGKSRLMLLLVSLVTSTLVLVLLPSTAHSIYPYGSAPQNIEEIKSKISDSLVLVKYGANPQLAFSATYDITQSLKDQGTYSILVTPETPLSNCFRTPYDLRRLGLNLEYKGKGYKGTCYGWGIEYVDMASIHTTVAIPQLSLWDSYWPQIGGWLIAVYYLPSFGITFQETRVGIVDKARYVLGIEKFASPPPDGLALIFNQDSSFVGIMTNKSYGTVPDQYFKVHGAPLQCDLPGNDGNSLTRCNETRKTVNESAQAGVWTVDSVSAPIPTPKPTPTPTPTSFTNAQDASKEGKAAYDSSINTYNLYRKSRQDCLSSFTPKNSSEKNIVSLVDYNRLCSSEEKNVESIYRSLIGLKALASSATVTMTTIDQIYRMNEEMVEAVDTMSVGSSLGIALISSHEAYGNIIREISSFNASVKSINELLAKFPNKTRALLVNSEAFFEYREFIEVFSELETELSLAKNDFASIETPDSIHLNLIENLKGIYRAIPRSTLVNRAITRAKAGIPRFYCKKGSIFALPTGNACSSGFTRVVPKK